MTSKIQDQPVPHGQGTAIQALVIEDMKERMEVGLDRYGEYLKKFNGRDALVDIYQELIDGVVYIRQVIEEEKSLRYMLIKMFEAEMSCDNDKVFEIRAELKKLIKVGTKVDTKEK